MLKWNNCKKECDRNYNRRVNKYGVSNMARMYILKGEF